jgi:hypothetical protein
VDGCSGEQRKHENVIPRLILAGAALLAGALARRTPAHRPIAAALGGALALDVLRAGVVLPGRLDLALYLASPALSAWCALRVLACACSCRSAMVVFGAWWLGALAVLRAPVPALWWAAVPQQAHGAALLVEALAVLAFWRSPRRGGCTEGCVLVLVAGDAVGLLGPAGLMPGPWWLVSSQAAIVGAGLVVLQAAALLEARSRGGAP